MYPRVRTNLFNIIGEMCQGWLPGKPNTEASFKRKVCVMSNAAERSGRSIDARPLIANEESDEILSKEIISYFKSKR